MATTVRRIGFATPRALELRAIQQAIDSIRERFVSLEAQVDALAAAGASNAQAEAIATLQAQVKALQGGAGAAQSGTASLDLSTLTVLVQSLGPNR